jgi:hypothetical protein
MKDIPLTDVTVHIDENVDHATREQIQDKVRALPGVVAAVSHDQRPHLMVVEYNPQQVDSQVILGCVKDQGVHAELIGL